MSEEYNIDGFQVIESDRITLLPEREYKSVWVAPHGTKITIESYLEPTLPFILEVFKACVKSIEEEDFLYVDKDNINND